ncbi:mannosyltransferase, partial [Serendipita sp. 399]
MSTAIPGTQQLRLRKPINAAAPNESSSKPKSATVEDRELLKDKKAYPTQRSAPSWSPSFSSAVRLLLLVRFCAAMYSNISDCDEVFNFWEPLHYIHHGYGFQTWEVSPQFAIRSWAYIFLHYPYAILGSFLTKGKRPSFFAVRVALGLFSTLCEAKLYRAVVESISARVGMYFLIMSLTSTGMWISSTGMLQFSLYSGGQMIIRLSAFLPSTFAMYFNMLAFSFALFPAKSKRPHATDSRTLFATVLFGAGAIIGWPFSIVVSFPFVFEELFVFSGDKVLSIAVGRWLSERWIRMLGCVFLASLLFIPIIGIDSIAYGELAIVPWNIIYYNIFGGTERGPELYGTEPWHFYLSNLVLNFNVLVGLALLSLPALVITSRVDRNRLGTNKPSDYETSPYLLLSIRLAPFYLWLGILSLQPHKEERFMFPIYPFLCFNAAVALYLIRGWLETFYIRMTSQYQASKSSTMSLFTANVLVASALISFLRIAALFNYYHSPLSVAFHFEHVELPRLLNATNLIPPYDPSRDGRYIDDREIDLSPIKQLDLRLCIGKEWYRFPGHYLIPSGIEVRFMKSGFDGLLPQPFPPSDGTTSTWPWDGMRIASSELNDLNKESFTFYVDSSTCDYIIDSDFLARSSGLSELEPRFAQNHEFWER